MGNLVYLLISFLFFAIRSLCVPINYYTLGMDVSTQNSSSSSQTPTGVPTGVPSKASAPTGLPTLRTIETIFKSVDNGNRNFLDNLFSLDSQ